MIKHLYTPADVKKVREELYLNQKGIDPILQEEISENDTVCDHDHNTQHCRAALHRQSNAFEGRVFNAYLRNIAWLTDKSISCILRNLADYYEGDYTSNALHPGWMRKVMTEFRKLSSDKQNNVLRFFSDCTGKNKTEREKILKRLFKQKTYFELMAKIYEESKT